MWSGADRPEVWSPYRSRSLRRYHANKYFDGHIQYFEGRALPGTHLFRGDNCVIARIMILYKYLKLLAVCLHCFFTHFYCTDVDISILYGDRIDHNTDSVEVLLRSGLIPPT
jgi:hypothetical protein